MQVQYVIPDIKAIEIKLYKALEENPDAENLIDGLIATEGLEGDDAATVRSNVLRRLQKPKEVKPRKVAGHNPYKRLATMIGEMRY